jgi:hypothetical protein
MSDKGLSFGMALVVFALLLLLALAVVLTVDIGSL